MIHPGEVLEDERLREGTALLHIDEHGAYPVTFVVLKECPLVVVGHAPHYRDDGPVDEEIVELGILLLEMIE